METITIEYQPNFKEKLMNFLNSFDSNEVKVVYDDPFFETNKKQLSERLIELKEGRSESISIEEYELILEKTI